jgi:XPG domain containing
METLNGSYPTYHLFNSKSTFLFDGGLPERKRSEREKRYRNLLNNYIRNSLGQSSKNLPPAFVVVACQQTLRHFSDTAEFLLRVVPGEADDYCIEIAREDPDAIILSLDGDLFVHIGESGRLAPLERFPVEWDETISFSVYSNLRKEMGITHPNGLIEVAALLRRDTGMSVAQCITCVNRKQTLEHITVDELREYESVYLTREDFEISEEMGKALDTGILTGRLTEMLLGEEQIMWLPLLPVSNPPRKSAWGISRPVRMAAYHELYQQRLMKSRKVTEMDRRGPRMVEEPMSVEGVDAISIGDSRQDVFMAALNTLLDSDLDESELRTLPILISMFLSLGRSDTPSAVTAIIPSSLQYTCLQYQTLIYSFIVLLQSKNPYSTTIPEFATLWDWPIFRTSFSGPLVPEGQELWENLTATRDSAIRALYNTSSQGGKPKKRKSGRREADTPTNNDLSNRFSRLEIG